MKHAGGQAGQPLQVGRPVQVADQGRDALATQGAGIVGVGGQRQQTDAPPATELARGALAHVTAADDEHPFAAETGWKGTKKCHGFEFGKMAGCLRGRPRFSARSSKPL